MKSNSEIAPALRELLREHGVGSVLGQIVSEIERGEAVLREEHDSDLGNAFDLLVPMLVQLLPKVGKRLAAKVRFVLEAKCVVASMNIRHFSSAHQSPAVQEAYATLTAKKGEND